MYLFETLGFFLLGDGLGYGIVGRTANTKIIGWIVCAVGFSILQLLGAEL